MLFKISQITHIHVSIHKVHIYIKIDICIYLFHCTYTYYMPGELIFMFSRYFVCFLGNISS